ncbi:MAG TPA: tyrosine-type recombinase/integrase [Mycobacterium sp.]|nr:tyrosine-type recombinase/integrase [Mycobacterium sp.]
MANIAKRPDGRWRARYRDSRGKEHARHFARKVDAQAWLDSVTTAVQTGTYVDPAKAQITVGEWTTQWLRAQAHLKPSTRERYAGIARTHIDPRWAMLRLIDLSHADIQRWVGNLTATRSPSTARKAHRVLSLVLGLAVRDGRLARNPASDVRLPREAPTDRHYLTHEQVHELADACMTPGEFVTKRRIERQRRVCDYGLVILFLAYTGVRFGEMAALRVRRLDVLARRVEISESVTSVNGALTWGTPKTHARRWIGIPAFLADMLGEHVNGLGPDDLVFTTPQGVVLRASNFRRDVFTPAARQVGLDGLVPHTLRHTAASLAIAASADVKVVQQMLGHKSATMTLDLYGHLFDDRLDEVAGALDAAARATRQRPSKRRAERPVDQASSSRR